VSERVYATLAERAAVTVRGGHGAIVDAVYARASDRQVIERVAAAASVPFIGLWLDAPEPVLMARTERRRHDPSDADDNVIRTQTAQGAGEVGWCRIDASRSAPSVLSHIINCLRERVHGALNIAADEVP
jgi:hypothetical protein